jgi:hypothetical protein
MSDMLIDANGRGSIHQVGRSDFATLGYDGLDETEELYRVRFKTGDFFGELAMVSRTINKCPIIIRRTEKRLSFVACRDFTEIRAELLFSVGDGDTANSNGHRRGDNVTADVEKNGISHVFIRCRYGL